MAKTQEALLGEVVSLLRKQNALSTRDRLRESEEAKRQEKIAAQGEVAGEQQSNIIDGAQDFQRRFLAGQAKTIVDRKTGNAPTGDTQTEMRDALKDAKEIIPSTLINIFNRLGTIKSIQQETLNLFYRGFNLDVKKIADDKKFRLKAIRDANEKRLEGIKGPGATAAGFGSRFDGFDISDADIVDDGKDGMSPLTAGLIGASGTGIGAALLLKMKKIKKFLGIGTKFGFRATMMARFGLLGKNLFKGRPLTAKQAAMAKNPRMWPILLAAIVATSFLNDSSQAEKEFSEEATPGGSPHDDSEKNMLDKSLSAVNTGLNVWIGYSIANFVSRKILKKTLFQAAKAMLIRAGATTAGRTLGSFVLRGLLAVGLGGAAFSAPVWGGILLAAYAGYKLMQWSTAMSHMDEMERETPVMTDATRHPPIPTGGITAPSELISAKMMNAVDIANAPNSMMDGIQRMRNRDQAFVLLNGTPIGARRQAVYKALIAKGWKKSELDAIMKEKGLPPISTMPPPRVPDMFLKSNMAKIGSYVEPDIYNRSGIRMSARQLQLQQIMTGNNSFSTADGPMMKFDMVPTWFKKIEDSITPSDSSDSSILVTGNDSSTTTTNSEIKIFNSYEPSWGGATSEAYERHTTFGGNGAGNWF